LVERASVCGCPEGWKKSEESCVSEYHTGVRDLVLDYFFEGVIHNISFSVYEGGSDYVKGISRVISYEGSEIKSRSDFNVRSFDDEIQEFLIRPLVKEIQNLAPNNKVNQARIAVSIVQNIPYFPSNETFSFAGLEVDYSRYPYEVLYDYAGICGEKSELLAFLLRDLGYDVAIFYFADENHEAVGIKCPVEESLYGSGYCFVETGGHAIISDISMEFSEGVRLESTPDVLVVSRGISLPEGLDEYRDADTLRNIQERNFFGYLKFWKKDNIIKKYDLANTYGIL